jgi:tetratricopeptide (TPR) repeat protein
MKSPKLGAKPVKLNLCVLILLGGLGGEAAAQRSEFAMGRDYYTEGEFKKAAAHFQLALKANPNDAECYYWMGMSYQVLADIAAPFDGRYNSKARIYLTKAVELAPSRSDYRRELFDFLLDSGGSSRAALRQAACMIVPEADPDYIYMRQRLDQARMVNASAGTRLRGLFLAVPQAAYRIADLPASAFSSRR